MDRPKTLPRKRVLLHKKRIKVTFAFHFKNICHIAYYTVDARLYVTYSTWCTG